MQVGHGLFDSHLETAEKSRREEKFIRTITVLTPGKQMTPSRRSGELANRNNAREDCQTVLPELALILDIRWYAFN